MTQMYKNMQRKLLGRRKKTENPPRHLWKGFRYGWAANYFPTVSRSIIVAAGLNFSVRNVKRCAPAQWPPLVSLGLAGWGKPTPAWTREAPRVKGAKPKLSGN